MVPSNKAVVFSILVCLSSCTRQSAPQGQVPEVDPIVVPGGTDFQYRRGLIQMRHPIGHHGYWVPPPDSAQPRKGGE